MKHQHLASALLLAAFAGLAAGSRDKNAPDGGTTRSLAHGADSAAARPATRSAYMERVDRELAGLRTFDGAQYYTSKDALMIEAGLFGAWARLVNEGGGFPLSPAEKGKVAQLRERVSGIQTREFPKMRQAYAKAIGDAMWEHDMEVTSGGQAHRTLRLTAAIFAANVNIKKTQETVYEPSMLFRFKRLEFRWYRGQDDFTYYDLESPSDGAVRNLTEQGWAPASTTH